MAYGNSNNDTDSYASSNSKSSLAVVVGGEEAGVLEGSIDFVHMSVLYTWQGAP